MSLSKPPLVHATPRAPARRLSKLHGAISPIVTASLANQQRTGPPSRLPYSYRYRDVPSAPTAVIPSSSLRMRLADARCASSTPAGADSYAPADQHAENWLDARPHSLTKWEHALQEIYGAEYLTFLSDPERTLHDTITARRALIARKQEEQLGTQGYANLQRQRAANLARRAALRASAWQQIRQDRRSRNPDFVDRPRDSLSGYLAPLLADAAARDAVRAFVRLLELAQDRRWGQADAARLVASRFQHPSLGPEELGMRRAVNGYARRRVMQGFQGEMQALPGSERGVQAVEAALMKTVLRLDLLRDPGLVLTEGLVRDFRMRFEERKREGGGEAGRGEAGRTEYG